MYEGRGPGVVKRLLGRNGRAGLGQPALSQILQADDTLRRATLGGLGGAVPVGDEAVEGGEQERAELAFRLLRFPDHRASEDDLAEEALS
jgi:hypothetical protein